MLLTFGEALFDLIPAPGTSLATAKSLEIRPGGAPLNVAIGLRRLGVPARYCGTLSNDPLGERLATLIASEHVQHVPASPVDRPTRLALVDHLPEGSSFRFYGEDPADAQTTEDDIDEALRGNMRGLYAGSLMMANDKGNQAQRYAVERARRLNIPLIVDPNPRLAAWPSAPAMRAACLWLIEQATLVKLSAQDARLLGLGSSPDEVLDNHQLAADVVVTDGENGCWALIDGRVVHVAGFTIDAEDPTGAGDAFLAGLTARYFSDGAVTKPGLRFAAAAGALATARPGAIDSLPTLADVQALTGEPGS